MADFLQSQENEVKNLTNKIQNHFNVHSNQSKYKQRYQKLLENRMILQDYQLKDSCNIFSKKQIDEQFFVTSPNFQEAYDKERKIINNLKQVIETREKGKQFSQNDNLSEKMKTFTSKIDDNDNMYLSSPMRRSSHFSVQKNTRDINDKQSTKGNFDDQFQIHSSFPIRSQTTKYSLNQLKLPNQPTKSNMIKMPTYQDYQKFKENNQLATLTCNTNLNSTFYETMKQNSDAEALTQRKKQIFSTISKSQSIELQQQDQNVQLPSQTITKKQFKDQNFQNHIRNPSQTDSQSVADKQCSFYNDDNLSCDFHSSKYTKFNGQKNNNHNIHIMTEQDQKQLKEYQIQQDKENKQKAYEKQSQLEKLDKFKYITKIDLEMGINYTFRHHMNRLKNDNTCLDHFQQQLNQQNGLNQISGVHLNINNQNSNYYNNNNWNGGDSKMNISVSKYGTSQLQSKAQLNSKANVSKTNAFSSSQLSVINEKSNKKKRNADDQNNFQDQHISSHPSSNQIVKGGQQNPSAVIEVPQNLFNRNNNKKRFSILPLQQSQNVVQNFNFPLQFLTSLSREESTKINTVQAFFPDFLNNLRYLEKSKQTKKRAARTLKKILGWSDKMAPLILNEEGTEIKKDLDFQTEFFEEIFRAQRQNLQKDINSSKKENNINSNNSKQNQTQNPGIISLSFDVIWENFQKYLYLNKNLIVLLEKKEKEQFKANRASLLEEIIDIHKMQSKQLNKFPLSNKQYQFLISLPKNIQHILDRKNYLQKEQALDTLETHELNLGKFPFLLQFQRVRSKYINLSNEVIRNYEKYV